MPVQHRLGDGEPGTVQVQPAGLLGFADKRERPQVAERIENPHPFKCALLFDRTLYAVIA